MDAKWTQNGRKNPDGPDGPKKRKTDSKNRKDGVFIYQTNKKAPRTLKAQKALIAPKNGARSWKIRASTWKNERKKDNTHE